MKIRELIVERISLTSHTSEVTGIIKKAVINIMNRKPKTLPSDKPDMNFFLIHNTLLVDSISASLESFVKSKFNIDITVKFSRLEKGVGGSYNSETNSISFNSSPLIKIINLLYQHYTTNDDIISEVSVIAHELTGIFIHEMTHVLQVKNGGTNREKSMIYNKGAVNQYVSGLEPDKAKQSKMLKQAGISRNQINLILAKDALSDPKNVAIYKGQPEEIVAFAHEYIVKQLSLIINKSKEEQLQFIANSLKELSKASSETPYSNMKEYASVYRRFLKSVYLELVSYRDSL